MQVTVYRGAGDSQGADIIDELLADVRAGTERGRQAINGSSTDRIQENGSCPLHSFIENGSLALVTETEQQWRGMIRYYQLNLTLDGSVFTADTAIRIEREQSE